MRYRRTSRAAILYWYLDTLEGTGCSDIDLADQNEENLVPRSQKWSFLVISVDFWTILIGWKVKN